MTRVLPKTEGAEAAAPVPLSRLGQVLAGSSRRVLVDFDLLGVGPVKIRLLTSAEMEDATVAVADWLRELAAKGITEDLLAAVTRMPVSKRHVREVLSRAVRDPDRPDSAIGTALEWSQLDEDVVGAAWQRYEDLRLELDPLSGELTAEQWSLVNEAVKKKDRSRLFGFGLTMLVLFATTTESPPSSSP